MRLLRLVLAGLLVAALDAVLLMTVGAAPASACSCAYAQPRQFVDGADEILAGTLVQVDQPSRGLFSSSSDPVSYTVAVDDVYRGTLGTEVEFESAQDGSSCGLEGMEVDRRYVVFLQTDGETRTASLCGGTALATDRLESAVARLAGAPTQPVGAPVGGARGDGPPWIAGAGVLATALVGGVLLLRRRGRTP